MSRRNGYEPSADYDHEADVLYISCSPEPSYCEEVDDFLLVRRGFYTEEITGITLIGVRDYLNKSSRTKEED